MGDQDPAKNPNWIGSGSGVEEQSEGEGSRAMQTDRPDPKDLIDALAVASWVQGFVSARIEGHGFSELTVETVPT